MEELKKIFKEIGYTEEEMNEIINEYGIRDLKPETLLENVKRNYSFFLSIGYSKEDVIKMTKSLPQIYSYSIDNMKQKIEDMEKLGYSKEDVIKMTKIFPAIYSLSIDNMKQKIEDMEKLGYSKEDVIKMTKTLPAIYSYSKENIKQKIEFYDSIGLHSLAIIDAKQLMQSTSLSYARYMYYKDIGIDIDETNYKKLFINKKIFEKQYGITKEELLAKYNYQEYMRKKNTQDLGQEVVDVLENTEYLGDTEETIGAYEKDEKIK